MICQEYPLPQAPFEGQEVTQEEVAEEDSHTEAEEDHQEEDHQEEDHQEEDYPMEEATITEDEDQTNWWETLQRYSEEYERKLSLSLLFGGSTQALTAKTPPSPMRTKEVSYSSRTFKGMMWPSGSNQ